MPLNISTPHTAQIGCFFRVPQSTESRQGLSPASNHVISLFYSHIHSIIVLPSKDALGFIFMIHEARAETEIGIVKYTKFGFGVNLGSNLSRFNLVSVKLRVLS